MGGIWYTSDLHIGHRLVAGLRGFSSTEEHDAALAANWDRLIKPDDQVWVLGDLSVGKGAKRTEITALEWVAVRPGIKHLISGNHDSCHPMHSEAHKRQAAYLEVFSSVQMAAVRKLAGQRVTLSHFPLAGDPEGDHTPENRFELWRLPNVGQFHLHGHTHNAEQLVHGKQIHVGLDAHHLRPVPQAWVEAQIEQYLAVAA